MVSGPITAVSFENLVVACGPSARLCNAHRGALLLVRDGALETAAELGAPTVLVEARKTPDRPQPQSHSLKSAWRKR